MDDILFHHDEYLFSYRVTGILIREGKLLLQKPLDEIGYDIPGGHVAFGETQEEALKREFKEEIGVAIEVGPLKWIAENYFRWDNKICQEICFYYEVTVKNELQLPMDDVFNGVEYTDGQHFQLDFHWKSIHALDQLAIYPTQVAEMLKQDDQTVQHFIYRERDLK